MNVSECFDLQCDNMIKICLFSRPLHFASANGLVAVVHYLLSRNVNHLIQDTEGGTS